VLKTELKIDQLPFVNKQIYSKISLLVQYTGILFFKNLAYLSRSPESSLAIKQWQIQRRVVPSRQIYANPVHRTRKSIKTERKIMTVEHIFVQTCTGNPVG
jgi:hypothetical protein